MNIRLARAAIKIGLAVGILFGAVSATAVNILIEPGTPSQTVNGSSIDTLPGVVVIGEEASWVSGGTGLTGIGTCWPSGIACDAGGTAVSPTVAASNIDHYWLQGAGGSPATENILFLFSTAISEVVAVAGIDHGPLPFEALEFIVWGSNAVGDLVEEGAIVAVIDDGVDGSTAPPLLGGPGGTFLTVGETDDFSSVWTFGSSYTHFVVTPGDHIAGIDSPGEYEIDGLAAYVNWMTPDPVDDVAETIANRRQTTDDRRQTTDDRRQRRQTTDDILILDSEDVGDEPLMVTIPAKNSMHGPANGTVLITDCELQATCVVTYTPDAGFGGTDTFRYTVTDRDGDNDFATVTVTVDASVAAVATGGGNVILNCADNASCGIPFNWIYQFVDEPGELTTACCAANAVRETEGTGNGKFLYYKPSDLDVGQLILKTIEDTKTTVPAYAGDCANLLPLLPDIGNPNVFGYEPISVLRPWQRVAVNPTLIDNILDGTEDNNPPTPDPNETRNFYENETALGDLKWAICVTKSTAKVSGIALIAENPAQVAGVGYSIDCEEDRLRYRPMTVGNSVNTDDPDDPPEEVTRWLTTPWTAECDGSRSGKRSSTNIAMLNATNDIVQNGPASTVSRLLANLSGEISAEIGRVIAVDLDLEDEDNEAHVLDLENMHDKLVEAKDAVNAGKRAVKSKKNHQEPGDAYQDAIDALDELTCQALDLDDPLDETM